MKKLLWVAALAMFAAFPAAANADGIAFAGTENAWTGVGSPGGRSHYVTMQLPKETVVTEVGPHGAILNYSSLRGHWGIPIVAFDGSKAGLSGDGKILVLAQPPIGQMRTVSRFPVLRTKNLRLLQTVVLQGSFSFDALSPDGRTLYLLEHVNRNDVAEYQVRAYDLNEDRLLPYVIRDHREEEVEMYGYPMSRVMSPDGRWAYTLYQGQHHSFVHALDTEARDAFCIDLPMDTPPEYVADSRLLLDPAATTLTVKSRSAGVLGMIDTKALEFRPPADESPTAVVPQGDEGLSWAAVGGALALLLLAVGVLLRKRLRPAPAVVADEGRDQSGEGDAGAHLDEQPRLVGSVYAGYEPTDGDPDTGGEGRQEEQNRGRLVPGPAEAHPEHVVGKRENGHNGSGEHAREELLRRGGSPRGDAHDRRRQPGREHLPRDLERVHD
jgi:hypothetical protein